MQKLLERPAKNNKPEESTETRTERFRRIAESRVNAILEKFRLLGNCANKSSYDYKEEEINLIFSVIEKELKNTKAKFHIAKPTNKKFTLN